MGDTPLDLQAGTNAGVRELVGVLAGLRGRELLELEPHTQLLANVADMPGRMESRLLREAAAD